MASVDGPSAEIDPETPFRIALFGDFGGRASRGLVRRGDELAALPTIPVDRDDLDTAMAKLGVEVSLPLAEEGSGRIALRFEELDDFHPDRLLERVELFDALLRTRRGLGNPATFATAAAEVRGWAARTAEPEPLAPAHEATETGPAPSGADLLDAILGGSATPKPAAGPGRPLSDIDALVREAVRPYVLPAEDPQQAELVAAVDEAIAGLLRAILHDPGFQTVEAAWRAVRFLVTRVETGPELKIHLVDVSKEELAADLASTDDLRSTGIYKLLVGQTVETLGAGPWALLIGDYTFGEGRADAEMLGRLARIAARAGAPLISGASPRLVGSASLAAAPDPDDWRPLASEADAEAWAALRRLPEAAYVGLALPRFLLRFPYGKDTDPVETIDFEEMPDPPEHETYLWGNPALVCAYVLTRAFNEYGWRLSAGVHGDVDGLPAHVYRDGLETVMKPCAEIALRERAAGVMIDAGLMPLASFVGRDAVRLVRLQSVAHPAQPLQGRWR
jgi:type VI secretion system protein ImpC